MSRTVDNGPEQRPSAAAGSRSRSYSLPPVVVAPLAALALAGLSLLAFHAAGRQPGSARHSDPATLALGTEGARQAADRRAALESQVARNPDDHRAAVGLASSLIITERLAIVHRHDAREAVAGSKTFEDRELEIAAAVRRSPEMAAAQRLLRRVIARSPDAELRGRAWRLLAVLHAHRREPDEQIRCLREAVRACPREEWRSVLENAERRFAREGQSSPGAAAE